MSLLRPGRAGLRELLAEVGDVSYVWRHLPLNDVHPSAQQAAEAAEAAAEQGRFWEMHDRAARPPGRPATARPRPSRRELGLDVDRFTDDLRTHAGAARVAEDVDGAT